MEIAKMDIIRVDKRVKPDGILHLDFPVIVTKEGAKGTIFFANSLMLVIHNIGNFKRLDGLGIRRWRFE
jgi:hypothetical protein